MSPDLEALWLTAKLAFISTSLLLLICTPLAWWLSRGHHWFKTLVQTLCSLPLVLPPTVLGFYLLLLLSPASTMGSWWLELTGSSLAFTFYGLIIGSVIYSLPFVLQPLITGFSQMQKSLETVAKSFGANSWHYFWEIALPLNRIAFSSAAIIGFAHTLGEFGVVLMIGGNIPGETRVVSIALFDHVESLNYGQAHQLAFTLLIFSFILLFAMVKLNQPRKAI